MKPKFVALPWETPPSVAPRWYSWFLPSHPRMATVLPAFRTFNLPSHCHSLSGMVFLLIFTWPGTFLPEPLWPPPFRFFSDHLTYKSLSDMLITLPCFFFFLCGTSLLSFLPHSSHVIKFMHSEVPRIMFTLFLNGPHWLE